ncbi:14-3-3 protein [Periconia macrospinosa]|uniref:14-3-3 protein n=1 Tax=Periconia macrospinosa TaxID=97972 RepID=A0A2V1CXK3_9PLEO|nr:14-3-3 protein [Periconia macrospinosa]
MTYERESKTFLAQLCRQAERYDEMVIYMTEVANLGEGLSMEESNLLSAAYQKALSKSKGSDKHVDTVRDYLYKIEAELESLCQDILDVLDEFLMPKAESGDLKEFYHRMRGDCHRYLAEFSLGEERKVTASAAYEAYQTATEIAQPELAPTHPIRLGLALNFSVFYYEILNSPDLACHLAKQAFVDATDPLPGGPGCDGTLVMRLLHDNITHWTLFGGTDHTMGAAQPSS